MTSRSGLRGKAISSVIWSVIRFGGDQVFNFVVFAVLARFLNPSEFGTFIVALITAEIGRIVAQGGLVNSLYRVPEVTLIIANTVFWANLAVAVVYAAGVSACASAIAEALGSAAAGPVIKALAFIVPISAAGASHMSRNLREFGHRALAIRSLAGGLVGGSLAVAAAMHGWGIWALVIQRVSVEVIGTIVAWTSFRWTPSLQFSFRVLREQYGLGIGVAGSQLLFVALNRLQDVIVGRMIGLPSVGIYRTSWKTIEVIVQGLITPISSVSIPVLAKMRNDPESIKKNYLKMLSVSSALAFPAIAGGGAVAGLLIPFLYGPQWQASVPIAWVLAFMAPAFVLNSFGDAALTVQGHSKTILGRAIIQIFLTLCFCIPAAKFGLIWFAVAFVAHEYVAQIFQIRMFTRATSITLAEVLNAIGLPIAGSLIMAILLIAIQRFIPGSHWTSFNLRLVYLAALVAFGALSYAFVIWLVMSPDKRRELIQVGRGTFT